MPELTPLDDNRQEHFLNGEDLEPITRREHFYAGREGELPEGHQEPETREEWFIKKYRGGGGGDITVESLSVTSNGTYTAPSGKAYSPVEVDVPLPQNAYLLKSVNTPTPIASFSNGEEMVMPTLKVAIEPQQDLHGYDSPWVGGSGKNKLDFTDTTVTSSRTIASDISLKAGDYIVAFDIKNNSNIEGYYLVRIGTTGIGGANFGANYSGRLSKTFTLSEDSVINIFVAGASSGYSFEFSKGQIELGSTATSYEPYSNICPISGWSEANVTRCGKNLCKSTIHGYVSSTDNLIIIDNDTESAIFYAFEGKTYTISSSATMNKSRLALVGTDIVENYTPILQREILADNVNTWTATWTGWTVWYKCSSRQTAFDNSTQVELDSTATAYEPYNGTTYTIELDGTRYGGELDVVSGVLTVDRAYVDLGTLNWAYEHETNRERFSAQLSGVKWVSDAIPINAICSALVVTDFYAVYSHLTDNAIGMWNGKTLAVYSSAYTDVATFKTAMNGVQLVYELATPTTIQLTPTQVKSLLGQNNIWADTGDITDAEYFSKEV